MVEDPVFLIRPNPNHDESLYGYILRVMNKNLSNYRWLRTISNQDENWFRKLNILTIKDDELSSISIKLNKKKEDLEKLNLRITSDRKYNSHPQSEAVLKSYVSVDKMRICSKCLKEYGYLRKAWDLYAYTACHFHNEILIDYCPCCNKVLSLLSFSFFHCSYCGYDFCSNNTQFTEDIDVSKLVYEKLHNIETEPTLTNPMDKLSLNELIGVLILISNSLTENLEDKVSVVRRCNSSELNEYLLRAYKTFEEYPSNYFTYLDNMKFKRRQIVKKMASGITRDFGEFPRNTYSISFNGNGLDFLRVGFETYLDNHLQDYISSTFRKSDFFKNKYITGFQTLKMLGLKIEVIRSLIKQGILKGYYKPNNRLYNTILLRKDVIEFKADMLKGVGSGLANVIGLNDKEASRVVKWGIFSPIINKNRLSIFLKKEVLAVFDLIESKMLYQNIEDTMPLYTFRESIKLVREWNINLKNFINDLIEGVLVPTDISPNEEGFQRYLFSLNNLKRYIDRNLVDHTKGISSNGVQQEKYRRNHRGYLGDRSYVKSGQEREFYSIAESAKKLAVTSYDISHWIGRGFIEAIRVRDNLILVKKESLKHFYEKYWSISYLKLENTGIINKQFSKYLIKKDVKPISGPSIDGYAKFLFYREDVNIYIEEFKEI